LLKKDQFEDILSMYSIYITAYAKEWYGFTPVSCEKCPD
jgi:hypothetical protein